MTEREKELRLEAYEAIVEQYNLDMKEKSVESMTNFEMVTGMIIEVTESAIAVIRHTNEVLKGAKPCET